MLRSLAQKTPLLLSLQRPLLNAPAASRLALSANMSITQTCPSIISMINQVRTTISHNSGAAGRLPFAEASIASSESGPLHRHPVTTCSKPK